MKAVAVFLAFALALPLLFVVGIALGPAILVALLVLAWAVPAVLVAAEFVHHNGRRWGPPQPH